ncbi:MAG: hypothetical protein ACKN9T_19120 [Candidatus Methylumidiphilus sp.]
MKEFDLVELLASLEQYGINPKTALIIAASLVIAVLLALVVYVLRKGADKPDAPISTRDSTATARKGRKPDAPTQPIFDEAYFDADEPTEEPAPFVAQVTPIQPIRQETAKAPEIAEPPTKPSATVTPIRPLRQTPPAPKAPAAEPPARKYPIPQDSVLRRHHLTHVRYLVETVSLPRPTECVLLRHWEQLISSRVEECLHHDAHMEKLLKAYDEHRKNALAA